MALKYLFLFLVVFFGLKTQAVPLQSAAEYEVDDNNNNNNDNNGEDDIDYVLRDQDQNYQESLPEQYSDYNTENFINTQSNSNRDKKIEPSLYKTKHYIGDSKTNDDIDKQEKYFNDYDNNSKLLHSKNYPDDVSQVDILKDKNEKILKVKEEENVDEMCINNSKINQHFSVNFGSNISSLLPEEDLKISGKPKSKRKIKVYTGEDVTLCWIETLTYKEDKSVFDSPNRQIFREFSISFENSVGIPDNYLTCLKTEKKEILDDTTEICNTSFTEGIHRNTQKSKVVKLQSFSRQGNIWITEIKTVRCGVGSVVTKDVLSTLADFKNPIKRVEIKVSPSTYNVHEYCNSPQENQNPNIQFHHVNSIEPCLGNECLNENTEPSTTRSLQESDESESDEILSTGVTHNPLTTVTPKNNTMLSPDDQSDVNQINNSLSSNCDDLSQINSSISRLNCLNGNILNKSSSDEHPSQSAEDSSFSSTTTEISLGGLFLRKPQVSIKSGGEYFPNFFKKETTTIEPEVDTSNTMITLDNIQNFSTPLESLITSLNDSLKESLIPENNLVDKEDLTLQKELINNNKTGNTSEECLDSKEKLDSTESLVCSTEGSNCSKISLQSSSENVFSFTTEANNFDIKDSDDISNSEDCENNLEDVVSSNESNQVKQEGNVHDHNTQPTLLSDDLSFTSLSSAKGTQETTLAVDVPKESTNTNGKHKLALKIKVSLEHVGEEDEEQRKIADIEKNLTLDGNTNDQGNNILFQHLQALNNTGNNFDSIKQLFNCSILDKISDNVIGRRSSGRTKIKSPKRTRIVDSEKKSTQSRERRSLDTNAERNSSVVKNGKIRKCLSEIHEDIKTGLDTMLSEISASHNNSMNSTLEENQLDSIKFSNISSNVNSLKINERITRSIKTEEMRELSRWSNKRFINLDDGDQLYTITELIIFNNSEDS